MHIRVLVSAAFGLVLLTTTARADVATLWKTCTGNPDADSRVEIKSCTEILVSKRLPRAERARAHRNRGVAYLQLIYDRPIDETEGDLKRAFDDFNQALKLNAKDPWTYYHRGMAFLGAYANRQAIADFNAALKLNARFAEAHFQRGFAHFRLSEYQRAVADYTEVIRLVPNHAEAFSRRAYVFEQMGERQRAIGDYTEAIRLEPSRAEHYADRAKILGELGVLDRAIADFAEAIRLEPSKGDHHARRGFLHFYRAAFAEAAVDLDRAVTLKPSGILSSYAPIFRYLARRRAGQDAEAELAALAATCKYPVAVIELFLGRVSLETVLKSTSNASRGVRCETDFYLGEWHLIREERDDARMRLQTAAEPGCRFTNPHYFAAAAELKRMEL